MIHAGSNSTAGNHARSILHACIIQYSLFIISLMLAVCIIHYSLFIAYFINHDFIIHYFIVILSFSDLFPVSVTFFRSVSLNVNPWLAATVHSPTDWRRPYWIFVYTYTVIHCTVQRTQYGWINNTAHP